MTDRRPTIKPQRRTLNGYRVNSRWDKDKGWVYDVLPAGHDTVLFSVERPETTGISDFGEFWRAVRSVCAVKVD